MTPGPIVTMDRWGSLVYVQVPAAEIVASAPRAALDIAAINRERGLGTPGRGDYEDWLCYACGGGWIHNPADYAVLKRGEAAFLKAAAGNRYVPAEDAPRVAPRVTRDVLRSLAVAGVTQLHLVHGSAQDAVAELRRRVPEIDPDLARRVVADARRR